MAALSNKIAAALKGVGGRPEWHAESLAILRGLTTRQMGAAALVPVVPEMRSSSLTSSATASLSSSVAPRRKFYSDLIVSKLVDHGVTTKKSELCCHHAVDRILKKMVKPRALVVAPAPQRPAWFRPKNACRDRSCGGEVVADARSGDLTCHECGLSRPGVHGTTFFGVDAKTGVNHLQHAKLDNFLQSTSVDPSHSFSRTLNVALRAVRDGRFVGSGNDLHYGMKKSTPESQKRIARLCFEELVESTALPVTFVARACSHFNWYRDGPGVHSMNMIEVAVAATLASLPPENVSCLAVCRTVAAIGDVALPTTTCVRIADALGNQRGGLKTAVLAGRSVNLLGHEHVFANVHGRTVVTPRVALTHRFQGRAQLRRGRTLRIYATRGGRVVSREDLLVSASGRFRGTLSLTHAADLLHFDVFRLVPRRLPGCISKPKRVVVHRASAPLVGPWRVICTQMILDMGPWAPRLTLQRGCNTRFTTLYDLKHHVCCEQRVPGEKQTVVSTHKRKRLRELSGLTKRRRL